jgi:hypothetical protein
MILSRRNLLALAGTGAVLAEAAAQTQTPPPKPSTPEERVAAAREDNRRSAERLAKFDIPISTEPAFLFRA